MKDVVLPTESELAEMLSEIADSQYDLQVTEFINENKGMIIDLAAKHSMNADSSWFHDLIQEAYVTVHKSLRSFDMSKGVKLTTYMYTCIDRALINYRNNYDNLFSVRNSLNNPKELSNIKNIVEDPSDSASVDESTPLTVLREEEKSEAIDKGLNDLTEVERKLINLAFGLDTAQITSVEERIKLLGIKSVKEHNSILAKAKRKLAQNKDLLNLYKN